MAKFGRGKQSEDVMSKPYTMSTFMVQVVMTVVALLFLFPLFVILNYSFKTKKELYLTSPLKLPNSLQWANYVYRGQRIGSGAFVRRYSMGHFQRKGQVFQVLFCLFCNWYSDSVSGVVFADLYDWLQNAPDKHEIWYYIYVCCDGYFFRRISDEQFYVYSSAGAGRGGPYRRLFCGANLFCDCVSIVKTSLCHTDHYAGVSDLE